MQGTLEELHKGRFALANVISNIQKNVTSGKNHAGRSEDEEEKLPVPAPIHSSARPSVEPIEGPNTTYKSPTLGERKGAKLPQMTFETKHGTPFPWPRKPIWPRIPLETIPQMMTECKPNSTRVTARDVP